MKKMFRPRALPVLLLTPLLAIGTSLIIFTNRRELYLHPLQVLAVWIPILLIFQIPFLIRRWRETLIVLGATALTLLITKYLLGPIILKTIVLPGYELSIDHRPKPQKNSKNEDGVWPDIPSSQYRPEDFNIIFLGDSFTMGLGEPPKAAFPIQAGAMLQAAYPDKRIRVVNFGWPSSSPVLQLRQLEQIGAKYRPRLVVQAFDMTDFQEDIRYSAQLRRLGGSDARQLSIFKAVAVRFGQLFGENDVWELLKGRLIFSFPGRNDEVPLKRLFHMCQPLEKSEPLFQTSWNAILETNAFAEKLGARYVLVVLPRNEQYNRNEGVFEPELDRPECGPYLCEAFKYFEKQALTAEFPIHSCLQNFIDSGAARTTQAGDPHYNKIGHAIAARAVAGYLISDGVLEVQR